MEFANISIFDLVRNSYKWDELFLDEEHLLGILLFCKFDCKITCQGYGYLESFQKQYKAKRELSHKQMTMLKRLAKNLYWLWKYQLGEFWGQPKYGIAGILMAIRY